MLLEQPGKQFAAIFRLPAPGAPQRVRIGRRWRCTAGHTRVEESLVRLALFTVLPVLLGTAIVIFDQTAVEPGRPSDRTARLTNQSPRNATPPDRSTSR